MVTSLSSSRIWGLKKIIQAKISLHFLIIVVNKYHEPIFFWIVCDSSKSRNEAKISTEASLCHIQYSWILFVSYLENYRLKNAIGLLRITAHKRRIFSFPCCSQKSWPCQLLTQLLMWTMYKHSKERWKDKSRGTRKVNTLIGQLYYRVNYL